MEKKSTYEANLEEQAKNSQYQERLNKIKNLQERVKEARLDSVLEAMDYLRLSVATLGGEQNIDFVEVYRTYIKAHTRMPHNVSVFPFLNAGDNRNQNLSYVLTRILLPNPYVKGIRIMPSQSRGSFIILELGDKADVSSSDS